MRGRARPRSWTRPWCCRLLVEVSRALIAIAAYGGVRRADERVAPVQGNRTAEVGVCRTVARGELLHLTPRAIRLAKDVGRALKGMAVDSRIVRPDEGGAAVQGNRLAETGVRRTVARGELLHLTPRAIRLGEHIERALACVAADSGLRRTDEYGRALERD